MKSKKRLSVLVILAVMVAMLALPMSAYAAVKINKTKATVEVGKTVTLKITGAKKGTKIKWTTNKKDVATVSSKGVVKGIKAGKAKVTAKVGKKNYNCTVTVKAASGAPSSLVTKKTVVIDPFYIGEDNELHVGETVQLTASSQDPITWKSTNPAVATVDANGVVTAVKNGRTQIVARSTKDKTLYDSESIVVVEGKLITKENYTRFMNFALVQVPVVRYYRGEYRTDPADGVLKLGKWTYDATYTMKYEGPVRELRDFFVLQYLALDEASLNKGTDFDRTTFNPSITYKYVPWSIISMPKGTWSNPSFAVQGTRSTKRRFDETDFDFTRFRNGVLTYSAGYEDEPEEIFEADTYRNVYEYEYPADLVAKPIYAARITTGYNSDSRDSADKLSTEYRVNDLIDVTSLNVLDCDGRLFTK